MLTTTCGRSYICMLPVIFTLWNEAFWTLGGALLHCQDALYLLW